MAHNYTNEAICEVIKQFKTMRKGEERIVKFFASRENRVKAQRFVSYNYNERHWNDMVFSLRINCVMVEGEVYIKRIK